MTGARDAADGVSAARESAAVVAARRGAEAALEMHARGAPVRNVLAALTRCAEEIAGVGCVCSILVLDCDGLLRNGASPNLPADYVAAIDRLRPDANVGTCCAAAATGAVVLTPDFLADGKWTELRHLPMALGFVGAWSMPIKGADGRVLGTLGTYYRSRREPTVDERAGVAVLAGAAGVVLG